MLSPYLIVGEILKPQGVRGEIKVRPITNDPDRFWDLERVYLKQGERYEARAMRCTRVHDDFAYITLEGVNDRNGAEALRGVLLYVRREEAVALSEDENFICDLSASASCARCFSPARTMYTSLILRAAKCSCPRCAAWCWKWLCKTRAWCSMRTCCRSSPSIRTPKRRKSVHPA